jgi:hypothetical protein
LPFCNVKPPKNTCNQPAVALQELDSVGLLATPANPQPAALHLAAATQAAVPAALLQAAPFTHTIA